ncbi:GNAT family N-acetyltransferase [Polyangium fumosum]|uniref:GNAT family N-acetyltransferase n=1 Tax=Polyangium fumosum TaxID=889272 RepID=A0A4U1JJG4_9BACT|nr:GNAT family N-acetyltransferase [Polyangium fumosum]TKD12839.1 GNAT family N-acetyltransferase [Polyangium fumosum]
MEPVSIRLAHAGDVEALAQNHRAMALETEGKTLDPETTIRGTRAVIEDAAKGFYLVAEREGVTVGQLLVTFEWSDWRDGMFWWIQSVYVAEGARRTGVYRALHDHVLGKARTDKGVCGVRLYVDKENHHAQATYAAMGMHAAHYDVFEIDFVLG